MNKRKIALLVSSLCIASTLAACGGGNNPDSSGSGTATTTPGGDDTSSTAPVAEAKTGIASLIGADAKERTAILGTLEKYAVDNMITGLPLFENGAFQMYNPRVTKGVENYITGYGFGILREGKLTGDLTNEEVVKKNYYNTYDTSDPAKINALDDNGSQVDDLYSYIAGSYFGTKMNAAKNGYDWYGVLSTKDRPYIVKNGVAAFPEDPEATSDTWRIYVRTGEKGKVKYHTNSAREDRKAFDGVNIELDDYVDAFKILLCGKFKYYRGNELAKRSGYSSIKGAAAYYAGSTDGINDTLFEEKVGVKKGTDNVGDYIDVTLGAPTNRFYAMYSLASNLYAPINRRFFNLVTNDGANPKNYGGYDSNKDTTPVDNILSTSTYTLESWEEEKGIAFKRNDDWFERQENSQLYSIPGVYINIWTAAQKDPNYAFQQFLAGKIDAAGIPLDFIEQYKNDSRTTKVTGTSVFKLNVNSCTQEVWNQLFGSKGTVAQLGDNAYQCKPWMSNENFIRGLFYSIDRDAYAAKRGSIASTNYFSSNYMSDPEGGIAYNTTQEHKDALADFWGDTLATGGYSEALSKAAFNEAIKELMAEGKVKKKDKLVIDAWWMYPSHLKNYAPDIEEYVEKAFNESEQAKANELTLDVNSQAVDVWSDVYEKHLQVGKFDLGFGSISGNALDPLNFMEVLKSDNSSGFTLNWGKDTSDLDLEYKGETWSYNTLWAAVDHGVVMNKGVEAKAGEINNAKAEYKAGEGLKVAFDFRDGMAILRAAAEAGDEGAKELLKLPADQWSLDVSGLRLQVNAGYGDVTFDPTDGTVLFAEYYDPDTAAPLYYQELDSDVEDYVAYIVDGEELEEPVVGNPWVTGDVNFVTSGEGDDEVLDLGSFDLTISGNAGQMFASVGQIGIVMEVTQNINGVESLVTVSVALPVTNAPASPLAAE